MAGKAPDMPDGYSEYLKAFKLLDSERVDTESSLGSIPVTRIIEYAEWLGTDDVNNFIHIINDLDAYYVGVKRDKILKETKK
jgi:hypothetical protein